MMPGVDAWHFRLVLVHAAWGFQSRAHACSLWFLLVPCGRQGNSPGARGAVWQELRSVLNELHTRFPPGTAKTCRCFPLHLRPPPPAVPRRAQHAGGVCDGGAAAQHGACMPALLKQNAEYHSTPPHATTWMLEFQLKFVGPQMRASRAVANLLRAASAIHTQPCSIRFQPDNAQRGGTTTPPSHNRLRQPPPPH